MRNLLLLHGAIGAKDQLEPLKEKLNINYNVYSFNFSGHGKEGFEQLFNIEQFTKDTLSFLSSSNIDKVDIFGYSMGGYVALYLAKHHPEKVNRVTTLGTKFKWTPEIATNEVKMLNAEVIEAKIPQFANALSKRHGAEQWKTLLNKTAEMMLVMGDKNPLSLNDYQNISHNCKIMLADNDEMVTKEETLEVFKILPNSTFTTINNSKHPIEKVDLDQLEKEILKAM
jgi:esterase/lipase